MTKVRLTLLGLVLCALAACGGGGDDPDQVVGPPNCAAGACR